MNRQSSASSIASRTRQVIQKWGPGWVFVPRDLLAKLGTGDRGAVDVALHRLVAGGAIRRLGRGVYDSPKIHPRLGKLTPSIDDLAQAIARSTGERALASNATAANLLGVSTQVPARPVFLTDGPTRDLRMGRQVVRFRHVAPSRMAGHNTKAGLVLRAMRFLGKNGVHPRYVIHLHAQLSSADRKALQRIRLDAPAWMDPYVSQLVGDQSPVTNATA